MNDQNTLAEKVQKIAAEMRDAMRREDDGYPYAEFLSDMGDYIKDLEALLPTPTLEDMTPVARRECQWMQCEVRGDRRAIILIRDDRDHNHAVTLDPYGHTAHCPFESVTPLPDLPRLTWPGTEKDEDANTAKIGTLIESSNDPRLAALPIGSVLLDRDNDAVTKRDETWEGAGYYPDEGRDLGPWKVAHIGQEDDQ